MGKFTPFWSSKYRQEWIFGLTYIEYNVMKRYWKKMKKTIVGGIGATLKNAYILLRYLKIPRVHDFSHFLRKNNVESSYFWSRCILQGWFRDMPWWLRRGLYPARRGRTRGPCWKSLDAPEYPTCVPGRLHLRLVEPIERWNMLKEKEGITDVMVWGAV